MKRGRILRGKNGNEKIIWKKGGEIMGNPREGLRQIGRKITPYASRWALALALVGTYGMHAERTNAQGYEIPRGETRPVQAGDTLSGDVVVDGVRMHDGAADTGLVIVFNQSADVRAPWAASVTPGLDAQGIQNLVDAMYATGCLNGCRVVDVRYWPQDRNNPQGGGVQISVPRDAFQSQYPPQRYEVPVFPAPAPSFRRYEVPQPEGNTFQLRRGERVTLAAHSVIGGDVDVDGLPPDNNPNTGRVVHLMVPAEIHAREGGATVTTGITHEQALRKVAEFASRALVEGCQRGCFEGVQVIDYQGRPGYTPVYPYR